MEQELERLEGTVEDIIYLNEDNGYTVFEVSGGGVVTVVCGVVGELHAGESVVCRGRYENHATYGRQFHAQECETDMPKDLEAVYAFLASRSLPYIGARTAEELKIDIGSARMRGVKLEMDACGRSLVSGLPRAVTVSSEEMIEALDEPLRDLMSALHRMIERTPPELASDIFDEGITLSGGGAQLFGLDGVISDQLKIRTTLADEPDLCVAHGLSELIDDEERYENIDLVSGSRSDLLGDD